MKKVLIIEDIHQSGIKLLENNKNFSFEIVNNIEKNFLKNKIKDFDAITLKTFKFDNELIAVSYTHLTLPTNREV